MERIKRILVLICLVFSAFGSYCQSHFWAQSINSSSYAYVTGVAIDSNHNTYVLGLFNDTLKIGSRTILYKSNGYSPQAFLAKFDKDGNLKWCNSIYIKSSGTQTLNLNNLKVINTNKVMIYGYFSRTGILMLGSADSISNTSSSIAGTGFIAMYDSSGNVSEHLKVFDGNSIVTQINGQIDIDQQNNIYLTCRIGNGVVYSKTNSITTSTGTGGQCKVIKYKPGFDSVIWCKDLSNSNNFLVMKLRIGGDNNLYIASFLNGGTQTINKTSYTLSSNFVKGFLVILSPQGNFIHSGFINSDITQQDNIFDVAAKDTNQIYVLGYVKDSILRLGKWYRSANRFSRGSAYPYIGNISTSKGARWINLTKEKDSAGSSSYFSSGFFGRLNFDNNGNVYSSFQQYYNKLITIGGLTDTNRYNAGFAKFDSLGNALWLRSAAHIYDMQPDGRNLIYGGIYSSLSLHLKPFTLNAKSYAGFIAKTMDYEIVRGKVFTGPYCAGDTIRVPYTKIGEYDSTNYFVAELSDENGNFDGKEHELGRLKTNKDSFVIGKLPLFQVASSVKYRIRIRSTNPVVQSYYQYDVLRLLIYSRDKAEPGPTETICYGDSIKLNTYGGTIWTWSPKNNMSDSTLRQPLVWPSQSTTYKIIIGDSSGCGAPDTAYKQILVRQPLKTILNFNDTMVCSGKLSVPYYFTGGDSVNYKFQWYYINSPKSWFATKKGQFILKDTLNYILISANEKLAIILKDGCTNKPDTAYLTIRQSKLVLNTPFKDTTLCNGQTLKYKASATGGIAKYYAWQWKDLLSNTVLSTTDSLNIVTSKTLNVQLIANDGCKVLGDTATFEVKVKAELKAFTNLRDTAICLGKSLRYTATGQGGDATAYKFNWVLNNTLIDTSSTITLTSASTSTLSLILKDNCSPNDTITKTITIKPAPKAYFTWDLACSKTITKFQFIGTKPVTPTTTAFRWNFNNEAISNLENPTHQFASAGTSTTTLILTSSNGCNDSIKKTIKIKPQSKADFTANDVCEKDSVVFINKSIDATSYNWKFGDALKSTKDSPKHLYNINGVTMTFNVTLVAIVANGCSDSIVTAITTNANPKSDFSYTANQNVIDFKADQPGNTSYKWLFGNGDSSSTMDIKYTYPKSGTYTACLKTTNAAGCFSETCKEVSITVGVLTITKPKGFIIYPNPTSGNFTIEIDNPTEDVSIEVYDLLGNLIKTIETVSSKKTYSIELNSADGIYLVRVNNDGIVWNQKVSVAQ